MPRLPRSLAARLTLLFTAVFVSLSVIAVFITYTSLALNLDARIEADLRDDVIELRELFQAEGPERLKREIERESALGGPGGNYIRLFSTTNRQVIGSAAGFIGKPVWTEREFANVSDTGPVFRTVTRQSDGEEFRLILDSVGEGWVIEIGESLAEREEILDILVRTFGMAIIPVILIAALAGWFMSRAALQGVESVTRAAEDVAKGHFDRQVLVTDSGEEIDRLVDAFNIMVDRIRALMLEMRVMTDNIAHDLKSPLARLRATVEGTLREAESNTKLKLASEQILDECDRLLQMIDTTLDVAEVEAETSASAKNEVDLTQVVHEAVEIFEPIASDKQIQIRPQLEPDCKIYGNLRHIQRMLANLLDNALKYTPDGGAVEINMGKSNGFVTISVSDTGIGIHPQEQTRIFDRFYRCDDSRSMDGFGLGLSFVRAVAQAHEGRVEVQSKPSEGSRFLVSLPALNSSTLAS